MDMQNNRYFNILIAYQLMKSRKLTWRNTSTLIFWPYFDVVKTQDLDFQLSDMMDPEDTMVNHIVQNSGIQIIDCMFFIHFFDYLWS